MNGPGYVPAVSGHLRSAMGAVLALAAVILSTGPASMSERASVLAIFAVAWIAAVALTAKHTHKYPYRYYSYLIASHGKAALIMALVLALASWLASPFVTLPVIIWRAFGWFVLADLVVSLPRRRRRMTTAFDHTILTSREVSAQAHPHAAEGSHRPGYPEGDLPSFATISASLDDALVAHVRKTVPGFHDQLASVVLDDRDRINPRSSAPGDLVVSVVPLNQVLRMNRFLTGGGEDLKMGGHLVCRYEPLESRRTAIETKYGSLFRPVYLLHFLWHRACPKIPGLEQLYFLLTMGRNRALSKAEVWGRLSFCGFRVVAEEPDGAARLVTARRVALPITNRKPSYYPVVGLTKVGLDGEMLTTHKVRSMYPYSEFLQKQVFDDHGLSSNGKFKNDFRLTEYGKFLRRYWVDELPQLYDWLRGDIKLVGMRATSAHFLSLYPRDFIELYVRVKPGLIPPLFDERTGGFEDIVQTEFRYLRRYAEAPIRTDISYLWITFRDIVFRGVRSK